MAEIKKNPSGKKKSEKKYNSVSKKGAKRTSSAAAKGKKQAKKAKKPKVVLSTRKVIMMCAFICCFCALFLGLSVVLNSVSDENNEESQKVAVENPEKEDKRIETKTEPENSSQKSNSAVLQKTEPAKTSAQKISSADVNQKKSAQTASANQNKSVKVADASNSNQKASSESKNQVPSQKSSPQKSNSVQKTEPSKSSVQKNVASANANQNKSAQTASTNQNQKSAQTQKTSTASENQTKSSSASQSKNQVSSQQTAQAANQKPSQAANQKSTKVAVLNSNQNQNANEQALKNPRFDIPKAAKNATVVIVIDDAGRSVENVKKYASLPFPLTIAVLPRLAQSRECAQTSIKLGKEVILHQPMQSINHKLDPGPGKITVDMSFAEISSVLNANLDSLGPGVKGMNNHEGSEVTGDVIRIGAVLDVCKSRGIYFLDSRTTAATKAPQAALERGMKIYEKAGPYIDNDLTREKMLERMYETLRYANNHGHAIVIGHVDKSVNILPDLLAEMYPYMKAAGYRFATPSTLHYN